jgi:hypothetical protein
MKLCIICSGGCVTGVYADQDPHGLVEVEVMDYDEFDCEQTVDGETEKEAEARVEKEYPVTLL